MPATFRAHRDGRVLVVSFDNPPYQVVDRRLVTELTRLVRGLAHEPEIRSVVLTGREPGMFPTLYDVREMIAALDRVPLTLAPRASAALRNIVVGTAKTVPGARAGLARTPADGFLLLDAFTSLARSFERLDKVVIAAINGTALGGAWELALACDLRYLADDVEAVGQPEMALAAPPGGGGTQRLTRAAGAPRALEAIIDLRLPGPAEALRLGFVHRVVPADRLQAEALAAAHRLADRAPAAVAGVKRAIYEGTSRRLADGLALERRCFAGAVAARRAR